MWLYFDLLSFCGSKQRVMKKQSGSHKPQRASRLTIAKVACLHSRTTRYGSRQDPMIEGPRESIVMFSNCLLTIWASSDVFNLRASSDPTDMMHQKKQKKSDKLTTNCLCRFMSRFSMLSMLFPSNIWELHLHRLEGPGKTTCSGQLKSTWKRGFLYKAGAARQVTLCSFA